jgi:hypothetical protein
MGRRRNERSPVSVAENLWPDRRPRRSLVVVPEFPQ